MKLAEKTKVLVMADWFEPGFKAGGPIRSCVNFSRHLKNDLDIYVLTSDRDLGDNTSYSNIIKNKWIDFEPGIKIFYASPNKLSFLSIKKIIQKVNPDFVYLNSMFSKFLSFYPLLLKKIKAVKADVVLSPRGMLKDSAVQFKQRKKKYFLRFFRLAGLHKEAVFHCTDEREMQDVRKYFEGADAVMIPNLPGIQKPLKLIENKQAGELHLLFVGRIHPIKNLHFLLQFLKEVDAKVMLTIIAGIEDREYWEECKKIINDLPGNIRVNFKGEVQNDEVEEFISHNHAFILPTKGENFGHAIVESLAAGRPVIISDQTPWRNLPQWKAGWDISLGQPEKFREKTELFAEMNQEQLNEWCVGAWQFARKYFETSDIKEKYLKLFS